MKGKEIKKHLRDSLKKMLSKIDDNTEYNFEINQTVFDGCSSTYYVHPANDDQIKDMLTLYPRWDSITKDKIVKIFDYD